ncbi:sigma-70 family RNA polymerase sigma factor [Skermania piniformis]|uniref:sigma-70 family RNA polymerase sigma factor n=1 Tax=Skermania pinensis TaxID=39122 RepID=UPI00278C32CE|nr:sigma-70 family RNA polymerase sigma factor [Skermania piniformis]
MTTALALAAGRGDRHALEDFVRATQRDVWRFLAHQCDGQRADDLTQETFLRAMQALPSFAGRSSARTWLLSIARRVAIDDLRATLARPQSAGHEDWVAAADRVTRPANRHDGLVELEVLLDGLPIERREALILTQILGLSYAEAAEIAGCRVGTIRSRVARARDDLAHARRGDEAAGTA